MNEEIFALDIGTRKVMGIIARLGDGCLEVLDAEVIEHPNRPMFDGQIHSIDEVAKTVIKVKDNLEARYGKKLGKVGVAVAGRNLFTARGAAFQDLARVEKVTPDLIRALEFEAVDKISSASGKDLSEFYCVGYSPVYYELDGNRISSPVGHNAQSIAIEIIATFLPRIVLDSIFAVLRKAGLDAVNLTLEPIAAMNAIIPAEIRGLNIILVDIGAGTSDIAISREGVVFAYGMVSEAGDEITEAASHRFLVDFSTAEKIKRALETGGQIEYEDIWGRKRSVSAKEAKAVLAPAVKKLAGAIAKAGTELNGQTPSAVVLVGGGALTSNLIEELALSFNISKEKIGIRFPSIIGGFRDSTGKLSGPEAVTPIGIAMLTEKSEGLRFIEVEINKEKVILLDLAQKKDILGALTLSGIINKKRLYPRPGLALTVKVNGELRIIKGGFGSPANISLNGRQVSSLAEKITHGDKIEFQEAVNGEDARVTLQDLAIQDIFLINFNGVERQYPAPVLINGRRACPDEFVPDRANIELCPLKVKDVLKSENISLESLTERQILININGVPRIVSQRNFFLSINGLPGELETELKPRDELKFSPDIPAYYRVRDVVDTSAGVDKMRVHVDNRDIEMVIEKIQIFMNGQRVSADEFLIDGADIKVYCVQERKVILSEIFKYIEIDPQRVLGKKIKLLVNDAPAGFTTPLAEGARINLSFEER